MFALVARIVLSAGPWIRSILVFAGAGAAAYIGWPWAMSIRRLGEATQGVVEDPAKLPVKLNEDGSITVETKLGGLMPVIVIGGALVLLIALRRR